MGIQVNRCNFSNPTCVQSNSEFNRFVNTFFIEINEKIPLANFNDNKLNSISEK